MTTSPELLNEQNKTADQSTDEAPKTGESVDTTKQQGDDRQAQFEQIVRNVVGAKEAEIQKLRAQLEAAQVSAAQAETRPKATYDKFVEDPESVMEPVIERVLTRIMKPTLEETEALKKERIFNAAKEEMIAKAPATAALFRDPAFEATVRQNLMNQKNIDANSVYVVSTALAGQIAINDPDRYMQLVGRSSQPTTTKEKPKMETIPSIGSDPPPAPTRGSGEKQPWDALSQDELAAAKYLGKTPREYWLLSQPGPTDIDELRKTKEPK